jgi:hypothetical protein
MKEMNTFVCGIFAAIIIVSGFAACLQPTDNSSGSAHTHRWGAWSVTSTATCTTKGVKTRVCALNATHKETQDILIDPNAHDWEQVSGTGPTCTIAGNGIEKCKRCGTEKSGVLPALGHKYENWKVTKEPTCSAEGVETATCVRDGITTTTRAIPVNPNAHDWQQLSGTQATCTTEGNGQRKCKLCAKEETLETFPALGHNFADWTQTTAPTCTEEGVETGTCTRDGITTATRAIPVNLDAHDWQQKSGIPATCTTEGNGQRKCNICAKEEILEIFTALGHIYAWVTTTAPTCTTAGIETGTCTRDATHTNTRSIAIDPNAHGWGNNWIITTPPTTVQGGIETDTCTHNTSHIRTRTITAVTFTSITDFETYLSAQPANTAATAYTIKLNVNDLGNANIAGSVGAILRDNSTKFVTLDLSGSAKTGIEDNAFQSCTNLIDVNLPNTVTSIGESAFNGCTNLTSVNIPNGVTEIGASAFNRCIVLTSVNIPNSVTSIGIAAFQSCAGLTSINIPNNITEIKGSAFNRCTSLTSVTIPANVTSIGDWSFGNNTNLTSVTFQGTIAEDKFHTVGSFFGDLRDKFYATNSTNGTPGTYTTTAPVSASSVWTKQN